MNSEGSRIRDECARLAMEDMGEYLGKKEGEVAIFDATNTTRQRRQMLVDFCGREGRDLKFKLFFIESLCDDPEVSLPRILSSCIYSNLRLSTLILAK
jgi:hypothetical protein